MFHSPLDWINRQTNNCSGELISKRNQKSIQSITHRALMLFSSFFEHDFKKTANPSISCVHFKCQNQHIRDKYFVAALSLSEIMIGLVRILLRITLSSADLIAFVCGFVWRCRYYYGYCTYANIYIHYLLCLNMHYNHHQQSSTTLASSSPSLQYYYVSICILVTTYQLLNVFIICNLEFYIVLRFSCKQ